MTIFNSNFLSKTSVLLSAVLLSACGLSSSISDVVTEEEIAAVANQSTGDAISSGDSQGIDEVNDILNQLDLDLCTAPVGMQLTNEVLVGDSVTIELADSSIDTAFMVAGIGGHGGQIPIELLHVFSVDSSTAGGVVTVTTTENLFPNTPTLVQGFLFGQLGTETWCTNGLFHFNVFDEEPVVEPEGIFIEEDGLLVMEVESAPLAGDWVEETIWSGFAGESYYRWDGPDLYDQPGVGILEYRFNISKPGNYKLHFHSRHNGSAGDLHNDVWARMDGGSWIKIYSNEGAISLNVWNWYTEFDPGHNQVNYDLSVGEHVFEVSGRSSDFMIDRIHMYNDYNGDPLDLSLPESSQY